MWLAIAGSSYDFIETFNTKEEAEREIKKYFIENQYFYHIYDEYVINCVILRPEIKNFEARMNNCNDYDEFVKEFLEDLIDLEPIENYRLSDDTKFIVKEI